tara:strand:+ start:333 stop:515 length:183 start_codon:yes stop_codon:yes gene_type:complete
MKIKLKDKKNPITAMWCFTMGGYDSDIINKLNSGKEVEVEKIPKPALEFVKEIKITKGNK